MPTNTFMNNLQNSFSQHRTENGATAYSSTGYAVYDLFSFGAAYRKRSEDDCILLFRKAFADDPVYALKCLFMLRDAREGSGERRFFRVVLRDLARQNPDAVRRNIEHIPFFGRWDDLYCLVGTPCEADVFNLIKTQLAEDVKTAYPSLCAKWLASENTSSAETRKLGSRTRIALGLSHKEYRKLLSTLRARINIVERLMSENKWDEIDFSKVPSRAMYVYREAFKRHDLERAKAERPVQTYAEFAKDDTVKVNAKVLYPYECVYEALKLFRTGSYWSMRQLPAIDDTNRLMANKRWENLPDLFDGKDCDMMCVVDTSGSMVGNAPNSPINIAIGLGMYCAERLKGAFHGNYISFSRAPRLVPVEGVDFADKVQRIYRTNLCENTNLLATFELLRNIALRSRPEDIPQTIVVISDMEIDAGTGNGYGWMATPRQSGQKVMTEMEQERARWESLGLKMPKLVYWNVEARQDNILDLGPGVSYVSGASVNTFRQVVTGKTGLDLMYDALNADRYACIH